MRLACCFLGALGAVQYFCAHGRPRAAPGCRMPTFLCNNSPGTRSLDGLVGGRCSTTKAPYAAAKGPTTAPGLVVGVGCASRGGEAA